MIIKFKELSLQNFKSHQELRVNFGEETQITGDNAKGKSSIGEAITFLFYGTDTLNSKLDPTPITYVADETLVELLFEVDGTLTKLGRGIKKGKATFYINDVPSKATEFSNLVDSLFDKELFLSLFNPNYFFTLNWDKQRSLVMKYVTVPSSIEVLKHMPEVQAKELETLLKKNKLDDVEKIYKEQKLKCDKGHIQAQARVKTLRDELALNTDKVIPTDSIKVEINELNKSIEQRQKQLEDATAINNQINSINTRLSIVQGQIDRSKDDFKVLKALEIAEHCNVCKQSFTDVAKQAAEKDKQAKLDAHKDQHEKLKEQKAQLIAQLKVLDYVEISDLTREVSSLERKRVELQNELKKCDQLASLEERIHQASLEESETLRMLNYAISILDSVKDYRAKEAELQVKKVQDLFETLTIKLFETLKNGEIKATFEIEMDGKGYKKLSLSEGIRAGLELREVLSKQAELITPVFVDNSESITRFKAPTGQLIVSRVVANQQLKVEVSD